MTVRKLVVEVIDGRDLVPKDGQGTSNAYVVADFDGQRKRTRTVCKTLNPEWKEMLEFVVTDPSNMELEELEVEVYNDKRVGGSAGSARKNHFLGRVRICGSQFARKGDEALIYFPLEKKSLLSWIRGDIGLKIYYYDEPGPEPAPEQKPPELDSVQEEKKHPADANGQINPAPDVPQPTEMAVETQPPPPVSVVVIEEHPPPEHFPPEVRKMEAMAPPRSNSRRINGGDLTPRAISRQPSDPAPDRTTAYDLVEPMAYLFVKIVKARGLRTCEKPFVKLRTGSHVRSTRPGSGSNPEWHQVFSVPHGRPEPTLEISIWEDELFLGGVCFDLSDVPVRDHPDGPLAPQWYRLDGVDDKSDPTTATGDVMLAVWIGTQADEAFPEAKVYQSPKLWYLRVSVLEAQDLRLPNLPPGAPIEIRVKIQMGFQSARTRRSIIGSNLTSFSWSEDLLFVASEPLDEQLVVLVEDRSSKESMLLGLVAIGLGSVEQRLDERLVGSKWFNIENGGGYSGRVHLRLCLEGGYHVLDEAAYVCSDFRPTAKQLWKPPVGVLELGILGARGLLPMKTKGGAKGSTDAYCVAKYGKKWIRTRTVPDSFDPRWNEQYTWRVYDPCTVLTVGVFDNWRMFIMDPGATDDRPDYRIGKIRIRLSTLEANKVYTNSYPLLVLLRSGVKKMGELEIAVRFACPAMLPDTCAVYGQPLLPRMHYIRPIGVAQQEALRFAAIKTVACWLARAEPPMGPEVVRYMLDADSHVWSMRRCKANWFRIMVVLAWAVGLARWAHDIRTWKNPVTTVLVHVLYLVLVWYPDLVVPTGFVYLVLIGSWYYRFRPKVPAGMDAKLSQAETSELDELDEEFDNAPSTRPNEIVRARYERMRVLGARVQTVMGDVAAQGERIQALVSWRDPTATRVFIGVCTVVAVVMYVVPTKMVAVAVGFYLLRHPMFRDPMPPASLNFFRRLPSLSDRLL